MVVTAFIALPLPELPEEVPLDELPPELLLEPTPELPLELELLLELPLDEELELLPLELLDEELELLELELEPAPPDELLGATVSLPPLPPEPPQAVSMLALRIRASPTILCFIAQSPVLTKNHAPQAGETTGS